MWRAMEERKTGRPSQRMCAGCGGRAERDELVRLVVGDTAPYVAVDLGRRLAGRGLSVHPSRACIRSAVLRGGIARALRGRAQVEPESIERMLVQQLDRRVLGLLSAAHRAQSLVVGTDAVRAALRSNRGALLLRAGDLRGRGEELGRVAAARGCTSVTWGTKAELGRVFDRSELGALLVTDRGIARAVLDCLSQLEALSEDG